MISESIFDVIMNQMWCSSLTVICLSYKGVTARTKHTKEHMDLKNQLLHSFRRWYRWIMFYNWEKQQLYVEKKNPVHNWTFSHLRNRVEFEFL